MKKIILILNSLLVVIALSCSSGGETKGTGNEGNGEGTTENKNGTSKIDRGKRLEYIVGNWTLKDVSFEDVSKEKEEMQNQVILQLLMQASVTYNEDQTLLIRLGPGEEYSGTYDLSECGTKLIEVIHVPSSDGKVSKVESPSDIIELTNDELVLYDKEYKTVVTFSKK